jgi:NOL1/NOP2/sun family putative RNA methylase
MKPELESYLKEIPGFSLKNYEAIIAKPPPKSIRVNTLKVSKEKLRQRLEKQGWLLKEVPWCPEGFFTDRLLMGNTPEHLLGYYFIQDAASMLLAQVLAPQKGSLVLDLAAAPGSKATHIAQLMQLEGAIVANDESFDRIKALAANIQRCGVANAVITQLDGRYLPQFGKEMFDRVLVDAPCSGLGQIRVFSEIGQRWNEKSVQSLAKLQKGLIVAGFDCLKEGGTLVYSTCTLAPDENEAVVQELLEKRSNAMLEEIDIGKAKSHPALSEWRGKAFSSGILKCKRIYPYDNGTEGFFIAKISKASFPSDDEEIA